MGTHKSVKVTPAGETAPDIVGPHGHLVHVEYDDPDDAAALVAALATIKAKMKNPFLDHFNKLPPKAKAKKAKRAAPRRKKR